MDSYYFIGFVKQKPEFFFFFNFCVEWITFRDFDIEKSWSKP